MVVPAALISTLVFSPSGELLATIDEKGMLKLWSLATGRLQSNLSTRTVGEKLHSAVFRSDGSVLAAGELGKIYSWNTSDPESPALLLLVDGDVASMAYMEEQDGGHVVTASMSKSVDCLTALRAAAGGPTTDEVSAINDWPDHSGSDRPGKDLKDQALAIKSSASRYGSRLAVLGMQGVKVWRADSRKQSWEPINGAAKGCFSQITASGSITIRVGFALSQDGQLLAALSEDHNVIVWEVESGKKSTPLFNQSVIPSAAADFAFSSDNAVLQSVDYGWNLYRYPIAKEASCERR
jgi:WD40 repeat protein